MTTKQINWRWLPLLVALLVGILLAAGVYLSREPNRDALPSTLIGKPLPQFALPDLFREDHIVTNKDFAGTPYLLNVWGSWCPECRVEHPVLTKFADTKRIPVVGYNWKDEKQDAMKWLEQFGNPYYNVIVDQDSKTAIDFGVYGAPETFLIDGKGIVRWKYVGPVTQEVIDKQVTPLLDQIDKEAPGLFK